MISCEAYYAPNSLAELCFQIVPNKPNCDLYDFNYKLVSKQGSSSPELILTLDILWALQPIEQLNNSWQTMKTILFNKIYRTICLAGAILSVWQLHKASSLRDISKEVKINSKAMQKGKHPNTLACVISYLIKKFQLGLFAN